MRTGGEGSGTTSLKNADLFSLYINGALVYRKLSRTVYPWRRVQLPQASPKAYKGLNLGGFGIRSMGNVGDAGERVLPFETPGAK